MVPESATARRAGVIAVHSLDHFVFSVPDLDEAARFYDDFGLEVRGAATGCTCTRSAIPIGGAPYSRRRGRSACSTSRSAPMPRTSTR